jgi:replicative DNA helicase
MVNKKVLVPPIPKGIPPLPKIIPLPPEKFKTFYDVEELFKTTKGVSPPQAIDLEKLILGAMLIDKQAVDNVINILSSEVFLKSEHQHIFRAIKTLHNTGVGIDLKLVSRELRRVDKLYFAGGDSYLIHLITTIGGTAHVEFHSRIILQKYILRELIEQSSMVIEQSLVKDPDVFDLLSIVETGIQHIHHIAIKKNTDSGDGDAKQELMEKVEAVTNGEPSGVYTGIYEFDEWCGGFQKRELITFGARPGMGKTTAVLAILAKGSFEKGLPLAFFSLEMTKTDLKARLASRGTGIPYEKIRQGKLTLVELQIVFDYYDFIDASPLVLVDKMNVHETICAKIRKLVREEGVKMVVIDYVQLMKKARKSSDRTSDLNDITRDLKGLANELNIPIIIVAQLSRKVEERTSKRPMLSDLKQSGSIEEDSDTVIFLLRLAYYREETGMVLTPAEIGKTEMIVAKGRNTGTRNFWTFLDFTKYDFHSL